MLLCVKMDAIYHRLNSDAKEFVDSVRQCRFIDKSTCAVIPNSISNIYSQLILLDHQQERELGADAGLHEPMLMSILTDSDIDCSVFLELREGFQECGAVRQLLQEEGKIALVQLQNQQGNQQSLDSAIQYVKNYLHRLHNPAASAHIQGIDLSVGGLFKMAPKQNKTIYSRHVSHTRDISP